QLVIEKILAFDQLEFAQKRHALEKLLLLILVVRLHSVVAQNTGMKVDQGAEPFVEVRRNDVAYTQTMTADLVLIRRTDALQCRTDFVVALRLFIGLIQQLVRGQDNGGFLRNKEVLLHLQVVLLKLLYLGTKDDRIEDHAVADDVSRR